MPYDVKLASREQIRSASHSQAQQELQDMARAVCATRENRLRHGWLHLQGLGTDTVTLQRKQWYSSWRLGRSSRAQTLAHLRALVDRAYPANSGPATDTVRARLEEYIGTTRGRIGSRTFVRFVGELAASAASDLIPRSAHELPAGEPRGKSGSDVPQLDARAANDSPQTRQALNQLLAGLSDKIEQHEMGSGENAEEDGYEAAAFNLYIAARTDEAPNVGASVLGFAPIRHAYASEDVQGGQALIKQAIPHADLADLIDLLLQRALVRSSNNAVLEPQIRRSPVLATGIGGAWSADHDAALNFRIRAQATRLVSLLKDVEFGFADAAELQRHASACGDAAWDLLESIEPACASRRGKSISSTADLASALGRSDRFAQRRLEAAWFSRGDAQKLLDQMLCAGVTTNAHQLRTILQDISFRAPKLVATSDASA